MKKNELTADVAKTAFRYEPDTGRIVFINARVPARNGTEAGTIRNAGYRYICAFGHQYLAHRLAWLLFHGEWPPFDVDHRDGNRANNKICNLRSIKKSQNGQNQRHPHSRGVSGFLGVSWSNSHKKWRASIGINRRVIHLGRFTSPELAHAAYLEAKARFHPFQTIVPKEAKA